MLGIGLKSAGCSPSCNASSWKPTSRLTSAGNARMDLSESPRNRTGFTTEYT